MTDFTHGSLFICFASMKSRGRQPASYFYLHFSRFPLTSILLSTFEMLLGCWAKVAWEDDQDLIIFVSTTVITI